jgi:predicted nuclease of predicted toxin-antitoxin system
MKFLIDAQLPRRLVFIFRSAGHEATHVSTLSQGNRTQDSVINDYSLKNQCVVVTKDTDFVNSFLISKKPYKLLIVSTGNITNSELELILRSTIESITENFSSFDFIELNRSSVIFHS